MIIPKLLNFSDDPILLDYVIELEELFTSLMSKINNLHKKNNGSGGNEVKYIWLLKVQDLTNRIKTLADSIENEIEI